MIGLRFDTRKLDRGLRDLARGIKDMTPVARDFGAHMVRKWVMRFPRTGGHEAGGAGGPPAVQSADLRNSLTSKVRDGGAAVEMGTPLIYGMIQHFGGTIKPKEKKALTVSIADQSYGKRAIDFGDLNFLPSKGGGPSGHAIGVLGMGEGEDFKPLFALMEEVTLPERPWLVIEDDDYDYLGKRMVEHLDKVTAREGGGSGDTRVRDVHGRFI